MKVYLSDRIACYQCIRGSHYEISATPNPEGEFSGFGGGGNGTGSELSLEKAARNIRKSHKHLGDRVAKKTAIAPEKA